MENKKKRRVSSELAYVLATVLLAVSVAMLTRADFGISMLTAPVYMLHLATQETALPLTFGQAEYVIEAILFVIFCLLMKRVRALYFVSFGTGVFYGLLLDLCRMLPVLSEQSPAPALWARMLFFVAGELATALSVALYFRVYIYPAFYDFFVKGITEHFHLPPTAFKLGFDMALLVIGAVMSLLLFGQIFGYGIGYGTVLIAVINGPLIGMAGKLLDRFLEFTPTFPKLAKHFEE